MEDTWIIRIGENRYLVDDNGITKNREEAKQYFHKIDADEKAKIIHGTVEPF